jgi:hypothetical protein
MAVALAAPPLPSWARRGAVSSRNHITVTAPSGRSWLIRLQITLVVMIVITTAHAVEKKLNPNPILRSISSTNKKVTIPTPHAT